MSMNLAASSVSSRTQARHAHTGEFEMSDCFFFEISYNKCLKKEFTPTIKDRMLLSSCLNPTKCREYKPGYEHGVKISEEKK